MATATGKLDQAAEAIGQVLARDSTGQCLLCATDEQCRELARAAVEAIREPPVGYEKIVYHGDYGDDVWREMIDVVLNSTSHGSKIMHGASPDYAEILRLYRKYSERAGERLWEVFVRIGQELERSGKKERCPTCGHTDLVYSRLVDPWCNDPWHADAHLRRSK